MYIYNANVITMAEKNYENGFILIENDKIKAVGDMSQLKDFSPSDSDIDAKGRTAYPGFVDAHTHIGAWEDGLAFEGDDGNEDTDPSTPNLRAIDMINPLDHCFEEAAQAGVTSVVCGMGSANPIGGTFLAMKTAGSKRIDKRIIKNPVAVKFALGENPKNVYKDKDTAPVTRMATAAIIREQLFKARRYLDDMIDYESSAGTDDEGDRPEYDAKCEALMPLLKHEIPAHFHAHRADDYKVYDKYSDGDDFGDEGYIGRFRLIYYAIKNDLPIIARLNNRYGKEVTLRFFPKGFEYSEKDDKIRVIMDGCKYRQLNLGRIINCQLYTGTGLWNEKPETMQIRELTLQINDERNALERVMLHFAHFEKQAERVDDNKYLLHLKYYATDETEIVIRVLSFGPCVKVISPDSFVGLIKERLEEQKRCGVR